MLKSDVWSFCFVVKGSFPSTFMIQWGNASHSHQSFLNQFSCLLPAHYAKVCSSTLQNGIFHLRRISAENMLVRAVPAVIDVRCSGLVHSIAVLFRICPRLCSRAVLCHFVVVFLPTLARTFCLAMPPRCLQRCHFESRPSAFHFFSKNARAQAALLVDNKDASPSV